MLKLISPLFIVIFLVGCSLKEEILLSKPYHITIKNSKLRVSDTGFLNQKKSSLALQVFSAGTAILDLHVNDTQVCFDFTCVNKKRFNEEFFGFSHYDSLIEEILTMQPIYDRNNMQKTANGFEQNIMNTHFDITYKIKDHNLYFKDSKNNVLIKIRKLGE